MLREEFSETVEQARQLSNAVCEMAKLILRRALPHVEALQREQSHFSPRLMGLMQAQTTGTLPEIDRELLGLVLQHLEEFDQTLFVCLVALNDETAAIDIAEATAKCRDAIPGLRRTLADLEGMYARIGR